MRYRVRMVQVTDRKIQFIIVGMNIFGNSRQKLSSVEVLRMWMSEARVGLWMDDGHSVYG